MTTLKAALKEVCYLELEDIPSEEVLSEDNTLTFSATFERRMKKLIRRVDHPIRHRVAQAVACLLLAALLSGCTALAISPEAREAFVGWVREVSEEWFVYHYTGEEIEIWGDIVYRPTWIPEGYQAVTIDDRDTHTIIFYEDGEHILTFYCVIDVDAANLYIGPVNVLHVKVGDLPADLHIDPEENAASCIVWTNENGNLLWIHGPLSGDELIKMAESVEVREIGDTAEMTP